MNRFWYAKRDLGSGFSTRASTPESGETIKGISIVILPLEMITNPIKHSKRNMTSKLHTPTHNTMCDIAIRLQCSWTPIRKYTLAGMGWLIHLPS